MPGSDQKAFSILICGHLKGEPHEGRSSQEN